MNSRSRGSRLILAAIGGLAGLASGLLGVGGGFLIVPLQIMWLKTKPHRAGGTSLAAILPIALVGSAAYYFGRVPGQVDFVVAFFLVIGSTVGAYLGARYVHKMPDRALRIVVAVLLVLVGIDEILSGPFPGLLLAGHHGAPTALLPWQYALVTISGLIIGGLSGITGVGGGIFLVPTLVIGFGLSHHLAQGTSLVAILPTAAVGATTHLRQGGVNLRDAISIGIAGVPAALVGAALALSLPQAALALMFGLLLLFAAARVFPRLGPAVRAEMAEPQPVVRGAK